VLAADPRAALAAERPRETDTAASQHDEEVYSLLSEEPSSSRSMTSVSDPPSKLRRAASGARSPSLARESGRTLRPHGPARGWRCSGSRLTLCSGFTANAQPGRRVEGEARPRHLEAGGDVAKDVVVRAAQRLRAGGLEAAPAAEAPRRLTAMVEGAARHRCGARDERVAHAVPRVTRYVAVAEHPRVLEAVLLHHVHLAQLPRRVEVAWARGGVGGRRLGGGARPKCAFTRHKHARAVVRAAAARGEALDEPLALREELRELRAAVARRLRRRREGVAAGREGVCVRVAHPERAA